eukprot:2945601-Pyramimonas_sp.AAC.1
MCIRDRYHGPLKYGSLNGLDLGARTFDCFHFDVRTQPPPTPSSSQSPGIHNWHGPPRAHISSKRADSIPIPLAPESTAENDFGINLTVDVCRQWGVECILAVIGPGVPEAPLEGPVPDTSVPVPNAPGIPAGAISAMLSRGKVKVRSGATTAYSVL